MGSEADGALRKKEDKLTRPKQVIVDTSFEKLLEEAKRTDTRTRETWMATRSEVINLMAEGSHRKGYCPTDLLVYMDSFSRTPISGSLPH